MVKISEAMKGNTTSLSEMMNGEFRDFRLDIQRIGNRPSNLNINSLYNNLSVYTAIYH